MVLELQVMPHKHGAAASGRSGLRPLRSQPVKFSKRSLLFSGSGSTSGWVGPAGPAGTRRAAGRSRSALRLNSAG